MPLPAIQITMCESTTSKTDGIHFTPNHPPFTYCLSASQQTAGRTKVYNWHSSFYLFFFNSKDNIPRNLPNYSQSVSFKSMTSVFIPLTVSEALKGQPYRLTRRFTYILRYPHLPSLGQSIFFLPLFLLPVNLPFFFFCWLRIFYSPSTSASVPPSCRNDTFSMSRSSSSNSFPHFSPCSICPDLFQIFYSYY